MYTAIVVAHGTPALRQDWSWPVDAHSAASLWTTSTSGWDARGIGSPNLHLNDYLVGGTLSLIALASASFVALCVLCAGVGLACSLGAAELATSLGANVVGRAAACLIGLFNPWVYTETVAGHTYMLLAFGAMILFVVEVLRFHPRPILAAFLLALTLVQMQFFLPAFAFAMVAALYGGSRLPAITGFVVALPVFAGIAAEYGAFRSVPTNLEWELSQSTLPSSAALLGGYFAGYGQQFDILAAWPMRIVVALALVGIASSYRSPAAIAAALAGAISIAIASGLRGPLGGAMGWIFAHVPAAGLFRELFDILGFALAAYIAAASIAAARWRAASAALIACGVALAAVWFVCTPWAWWLPAESIPHARIDAQAGTRFALLPAFQPLTFKGRGSGIDPDAYLRGDVAPLNTSAPDFPVDAALAQYASVSDSSWLAALGVSAIVARPWLSTDSASRAHEIALAPDTQRPDRAARLTAQPRIALMPVPPAGRIDGVLGSGAVFFADVAGLQGVGVPAAWYAFKALIPVGPPGRFASAQRGWVDARLAFAANPRLAQAFGGAVTMSNFDSLPLVSGVSALAFVQGTLTAQDGRAVSGSTNGYAWLRIARNVTAVRCSGLCAIAAQGFPPANIPDNPTSASPKPLAYRTWTPWLLRANVTHGAAATLRLNDAFDRDWLALDANDHVLPHFRLDASVNAWIVPARRGPQSVWLVEWAAALQAALEIIGAVWLLVLAAIAWRNFQRAGFRATTMNPLASDGRMRNRLSKTLAIGCS